MKIGVFLFDGFSDWEIAYLGPEMRQSRKAEPVYFTADGYSVTSAGGLTVSPDASLQDIAVADFGMLVLPGGEAWEKEPLTIMNPLLRNFQMAGKFIAAICSATTFLAQNGYLENVKHTSNALSYLKQFAPAYRGDALYVSDQFAVSDRNIITANGTAPVAFSADIFRALRLLEEQEVDKWFDLFKYGEWSE